jgi:hypothetical protein
MIASRIHMGLASTSASLSSDNPGYGVSHYEVSGAYRGDRWREA